jgi:hypothetical protein
MDADFLAIAGIPGAEQLSAGGRLDLFKEFQTSQLFGG